MPPCNSTTCAPLSLSLSLRVYLFTFHITPRQGSICSNSPYIVNICFIGIRVIVICMNLRYIQCMSRNSAYMFTSLIHLNIYMLIYIYGIGFLTYGKQTECLYLALNCLILGIFFKLLSSLFHSLAPCILIADAAMSVV